MLTTVEIANAYANGQNLSRPFYKAPTQATVAGTWFDLCSSPGNPVAQYYFAAPLIAIALARSTDGGLDHGPNLGGSYTKYLSKFEIQSVSASAAASTYELLDYLMYYPGIPMDTGVVTLTTNISLPRYTDYKGIQIMLLEQNPYAGSCQFQVTYTNQDGTSGRLTPILTCNTQLVTGTIATSAPTQVGSCGRFLPLQGTDSGVKSIDSIEIMGAGDIGLLCLVLVKPLATFGIFEVTQSNQFDMWNDYSYLPIIKDDAYLNLICMPNGSLAGTSIIGNITTIWS